MLGQTLARETAPRYAAMLVRSHGLVTAARATRERRPSSGAARHAMSTARRVRSVPAAAPGAVWVLVIAVGLWALYGEGHVGYDGMYSLVWGRDIAHARLPDFRVPLAPTPHPLAIATGAVLAPFGT